jgi:hypothetical protein
MTQTDLTHDLTTVLDLVGDMPLPCDYFEDGRVLCQNDPAEWVMYRTPCCGRALTPALACAVCKEARVMDMISLECTGCGKVWEAAPDAYTMVEKLSKRGDR